MATSAARPSFGVDTFLKAVGLAGFGFVLLVLALVQMHFFYQKAGGVLQFLMASFAALSVVPFYTGLILLLDRHGVGRFITPVVGYFCAMFLHFLWNFSATFALPAVARSAGATALLMYPVMSFFIEGIPLLLLVVIAYFAWKREVAAIREGLAEEVQAGIVAPEEVEVLTRPRERSRRLWRVLTTRGPVAWNAARQLYDAQVDLAFALWRLRRGEAVERDVQALRERVRVLRERVRGLGVAP